MLIDLNTNLGHTNSSHDVYFSGVNVIFMGDFLHLSTISRLDMYIDTLSEWEYGHQLWRSINAIVLQIEQMRQSDYPEFAAALRRIRLHEPMPEDIRILNSRVSTPLECLTSISIVVRHHNQGWHRPISSVV